MPFLSNCTLQSVAVTRVLDRLFRAAEETDNFILAHARSEAEKRGAANDGDLADLFKEALLPIPPEMGTFIYILARTQRSRNIVEFGTSFGISTIHLASAVRDNGGGRVITTELTPDKARRARQNLEEAGLADLVDIRQGDALLTLRDLEDPVDLLLLDGWKNLYLPVLQRVEPRLRPGAVVIADDLDVFPEAHKPYLEYIRNPDNGYVSVEVPLGDRIEVSLRNVIG
jgi:predicted O-methyltransferase YrrM